VKHYNAAQNAQINKIINQICTTYPNPLVMGKKCQLFFYREVTIRLHRFMCMYAIMAWYNENYK